MLQNKKYTTGTYITLYVTTVFILNFQTVWKWICNYRKN